MSPTRRLTIAASVLLVAGVATAAVRGPATTSDAAATATAASHEDHGAADHGDHDEHGSTTTTRRLQPSPGTGVPGTTAATYAQMLAMDPDRAAAAHDHDEQHALEHAAPVAKPASVVPERLIVPAIGVDAAVIELGLEDDGSLEVPTDFAQTGWFANGPRPGRVGPAVIAGHVDSTSGPAVFHRLADLEPGDEIEVLGADGASVTFVVRETQQHPKDEFPTEAVYGGTAGSELRLITCSGDFDRGARSYVDNTIVFADRVADA